MSEPVLVIMAAGMGSRYGGLKQIDPVGSHGEIIIDYSLYDAFEAGFKRVVFVIKQSIEEDFRRIIGDRISGMAETHYVYQEVDVLPPDLEVPEGRIKPWGTGHAVLCAWEYIDGPFAVINADDYYGKHAFRLMYNYLKESVPVDGSHYCMVGYLLENTLTDYGHVARGVCVTSPDGRLLETVERTRVERRARLAQYTEDGGSTWVTIPKGSIVSMNLWGFSPTLMPRLADQFSRFMEEECRRDPLGAEFFLPTAVNTLIHQDQATVQVLPSPDRWYGVTYREDKPVVAKAVAEMRHSGIYPQRLWPERG